MVNYNNGKVYKIEPICEHEEGEIYIGSTTKEYLSKRMVAHRYDYTKYKKGKHPFMTIHALFDKYGIENCRIILLEIVNCNSKDELFAREGYYIRTLECVNKIIVGRTKKEYREEHKEHAKEYQKIYSKTYRQENQEVLSEKSKQYYQENKEKLIDKSKQYYQENKEKLIEQHKMKYICECGSETRILHKSRHFKSKKHIDFIESTINVSP